MLAVMRDPRQQDLFAELLVGLEIEPQPRVRRLPRARAVVGVNERGLPVGEDHHNAVLSDADVERLLDMHERDGWGYTRLARAFEISKSQARNIVLGRKRCQRPVRWKEVHLPGQGAGRM